VIELLPLAERVLLGAASTAGTLWGADTALPRLTATTAAARRGQGVLDELLHLHQTATGTARRLVEADDLDPSHHGLRPFRVIHGIDPVSGRWIQGRRGKSTAIIGPSGEGKTCWLASNVEAWVLAGGVAICGSEAPDVLDAVRKPCLHRGDVYLFDPLGTTAPQPRAGVIPVWWSPVPGADDQGVAVDRMSALCANAGEDAKNGSFFRDSAALLGACLLYAAALDGRPWSTVWDWICDYVSFPKVNHVGGAEQAMEIITSERGEDDPMAKTLFGYMPWVGGGDMETTENVLKTLRAALKWSAKPQLRAAVDAGSAQPLDMRRFLSTPSSSLHIVCPAGSGSDDVGPLVVGFLQALRAASRELAQEGSGRNPVPVLAAFDEVANYPMPELPQIVAVERKKDWTVVAVFQYLGQATEGWGAGFSAGLRQNCTTILLPGCTEDDLTQWASRMSGMRLVDRPMTSTSWDRNRELVEKDEEGGERTHTRQGWRWRRMARTESTQQAEVPRMTPQEVCDLDEGTAWVKDGRHAARVLRNLLHWKVRPFSRWTDLEEPAWVHRAAVTAAPVPVPTPQPDPEPVEDPEPLIPAASSDGKIVPITALGQHEQNEDGQMAATTEGA
jgi:TraM recognition site of TraD and TraG